MVPQWAVYGDSAAIRAALRIGIKVRLPGQEAVRTQSCDRLVGVFAFTAASAIRHKYMLA